MSKIVLIATNEEMYENAKTFKRSLKDKKEFEIYLAFMDGAVKLAKKFSSKDVCAIICRGASGQMLINSGIKIPVIDMPLTDVEVMQTLQKAKNLSGVEHPNIAFVGYSNTYSQIKEYLTAIDISIKHHYIDDEKDNKKIIEEIKDNNVDVIVAGKSTSIIADQYGIKNVIMKSSIESIEIAYNRALKMKCTIDKEKKISEERNTIINSISEIIISIDKDRLITIFNGSAEIDFKHKSEEVVGKSIYSVFKSLKPEIIDNIFNNGSESIGNIIEINDKTYSLSLNPVLVKDDVEGIVISMQEIKKIQSIESKVRQELYLKGNTAKYGFDDIIYKSNEMRNVLEMARNFSKIESNVLIFGETGTGKEMIAQSIHNASSRRNGPFVYIKNISLFVYK